MQTDWTENVHAEKYDCPDALIDYWPDSKEFVILIHDGGCSGLVISFCPWCGNKLAE